MRLLPLLFILLTARAGAAITVTLSPSPSNPALTFVDIQQDSPNPLFPPDGHTSGYLWGMSLSGQSVVQDPVLNGTSIVMEISPGGMSDSSGFSGTFTTFGLGMLDGLITPTLYMDLILQIQGNSTHQLTLTPTAQGVVAVDFAHFIPGTYTESSVIFGQVTTVVVPEPEALSLAIALAGAGLLRRRRD